MIDVKVARVQGKKGKIFYTVAVVFEHRDTGGHTLRSLCYQGRYKKVADAREKKRQLLSELNKKRGG